jgi:hypothetical protein
LRIRKLIVSLVAATLALPAQQAPPTAAAGGLEIVVVEGEGAKNNTRAHTATAPVVEVRDGGQPVEGAEVVFTLPPVGPGGNFYGWLKNQTAKTDAQGRATAAGYTPNSEEGRFNIKVTAVKGAKTGSAVISQSNVSGPGATMSGGKSRKGLWTVVGIAGGAAIAGGIVAATRGDGSPAGGSTARVPITIGAGPVTVAGPR